MADKISLSSRLETILKMVELNSIVADVGSDHGKLIISLFLKGIIKKGYAIENKVGPYKRLVKNIETYHLSDKIIPLFSDGITNLPSDVSSLILAGLGGKTIIDILKKYPHKLKNVSTLIIDAHSSLSLVREEISKMGFVIGDEKIIFEEGIYYEIIKFIKGDLAFYKKNDYKFGPILKEEKCEAFKDKYTKRIKDIDVLLSNNDLPKKRREELKDEKQTILGVLK